jgi:AraC family ethanolamine operon transcriptional activator
MEAIPLRAYERLVDDTLIEIDQVLDATSTDFKVKPNQRSRMAHQARDYMLDRESNPPSIIEMVDALNTSKRSLYYAFSETFGVSPKRFLKTRRLFTARQELKSTTDEKYVRDIALGLGFWELGYF